jgi:tRNA(fMet)-specific endonuclease VapC
VAVLIDTDVLIEEEHGRGTVADAIGSEAAAISVVTVSELLHGVHRARPAARPRRLAFVERIIAEFVAIEIDEAVARVHASLWSRLEQTGSTLAAHDLWIAATALTQGYGVATRNARDFARVPGLRVLPV